MLRVILILLLAAPCLSTAQYRITTYDFIEMVGLEYNAAGPFLIKTDTARNRVITANTLTSNVSVIDGATDFVTNIPVERRGYQHLKPEAMTISRLSGKVYLIGRKCFSIINPDVKKAETFQTEVQFESICVDESTGNVFLAGRESKELAFFSPAANKLQLMAWLDHEEKLINQNQTPPPPIRKVIAVNDDKNSIIALDGYTGTLHIFDGKTGKQIKQRELELAVGGRWHLAGYNEDTKKLYIVTENSKRRVEEAAEIDVFGRNDKVVKLPEGYSEPVSIFYYQKNGCVYISSDNVRTMYVVEFETPSLLKEVPMPDYGNDACGVDYENDKLYIGSWAFGEVHIFDLKENVFERKIPDMGIIPHMFAMTFNPKNGKLYFPLGASAVNGCFGAGITQLDPEMGIVKKIRLGWAPVDIVELKEKNTIMVFNNEDMIAELSPSGIFNAFQLPHNFPIEAVEGPGNSVYLSYGPHQSYWPVVYIWGAKNGILKISPNEEGDEPFDFYDRRIPRQAMQLAADTSGVLYMSMNNWGKEPQFIGRLLDGVRNFDINKRIKLQDSVQREVTQRVMKYDEDKHLLYLARLPEKDGDVGIFQAIDPAEEKEIKQLELGLNPTDMVMDKKNIYVSNFESNSVSIISKEDFSVKEFSTGAGPLKLCSANNKIYIINHLDKNLQILGEEKEYELPVDAMPDNIFSWNEKIFITAHNPKEMYVLEFKESDGEIHKVHKNDYPYGETGFDTDNSSFYVSGQYGDAIFSISKALVDQKDNLWITDFISGRVYRIQKQ